MKDRKTWLYIKGGLIILFTVTIFAMPVQDNFRKWLRFGMLCFFVFSFIIDLTNYKQKND
jgi:hypothetical protein